MSGAAPQFDFLASAAAAAATPPSDLKTPLTIFYNGRVLAFEVSPDKAEMIMKAAWGGEEANLKTPKTSATVSAEQHNKLLEKFNGGAQNADQARRRSLQSFLAKRKERVVSLSPYTPNGSNCAEIEK